MKTSCLALAAGLCAAGGAEAQLIDEPEPARLEARNPWQAQAFGKIRQPFPRPYAVNENATPNASLFDDYRTDPKLLVGLDLNSSLAIETGYVNQLSRGFHYVEYGRADERAGALGTKGSSTHLALKVTMPLSERLKAHGKLGVAYSERKYHTLTTTSQQDVDVGPYTSVGAQYRLTEKASVSAEYERYGDTAKKWGNDTNASGLRAKLKIGF